MVISTWVRLARNLPRVPLPGLYESGAENGRPPIHPKGSAREGLPGHRHAHAASYHGSVPGGTPPDKS